MPIQDIMNRPRSYGPSLSQRGDARDLAMAKGYAGVAGSMADTEAQRMENKTTQERSRILKEFEGRHDTPEFASKIGTVDPDLLIKMQERTADMDEGQRKQLKEKFERIATMAEMDDSDQKWLDRGWTVPFAERERIISHGMTLQQAFDYKKEEYKRKTGEGGEAWASKSADNSLIWRMVTSGYKGTYGPNKEFNFSNKAQHTEALKIAKNAAIIRRKAGGKLTPQEAVERATTEFLNKTGQAPDTQSAIKPGQGGEKDFSSYWGGKTQ